MLYKAVEAVRDGGEAAQTTVRMEQSETVASSGSVWRALCSGTANFCCIGIYKKSRGFKEIPALILTEPKSVNNALFCIFIEDVNSLGIDSNSDCVACASL